ncbi:asparagine synthase [Cryptosporangium sp. NPDC048952]|uniref:asparagine synthase n=1 Tax=Cryptosporangium sp. NPDC048952 TaxID=3363961 RepID=UPI00371CF177
MLETAVYDDGHRMLAVVRERLAGPGPVPIAVSSVSPTAYDRVRAGAVDWPGDYVLVEVLADHVRIAAGVLGVAPIYLAVDDDTLRGSWEILDLTDSVDAERLDAREAARHLTMRFRYTAATLFVDVRRLTERAVAIWDGARLRFDLPEPAPHSIARSLADGVDSDQILDAYEDLLADVLRRRPLDPCLLGVQLSGGLDSANTALSVAHLWPGRATAAAMLLPGASGAQQRRRRGILTGDGVYASDIQVPVIESGVTPLASSWVAEHGHRMRPFDDPHQPATVEMLSRLASAGITTVVTGVGGDEMVAVTEEEEPKPAVGADRPIQEWVGPDAVELARTPDEGIAPASVVNEMSLLAFGCGAPLILHAGLWPIHPLADPSLARFGEWLPPEWRRLKYLHRARLTRAGFGPEITNPLLRENFRTVVEWALPRNITPLLTGMLATGSPLFDQRLIDPDGLRSAVGRVNAGKAASRDVELYEVAAMHLAIAAAA